MSRTEWASASETATAHWRRPWIISSAVVAGVVALVVLVWGLGGFERRTDLLQPTPTGTLITVGPYEFTFVGVTAQKKKDYGDRIYWALTAVGTGRTTGDTSIAPDYGESGLFVSKDVKSGEIHVPESVRYGQGASNTDGSQFTPGLPPIPIRVEFQYAKSYQPADLLQLAVFQLEFTDNSLLGGQDPVWHKTTHAFDYRLPVKVLPEETT